MDDLILKAHKYAYNEGSKIIRGLGQPLYIVATEWDHIQGVVKLYAEGLNYDTKYDTVINENDLMLWQKDSLIIAYLHDSLEDWPNFTYERLRDEFGEYVANSVRKLTISKGEDRFDAISRRMLHDSETCIIKTMDRLENIIFAAKCYKYLKKRRKQFEYDEWISQIEKLIKYKEETIRIWSRSYDTRMMAYINLDVYISTIMNIALTQFN